MASGALRQVLNVQAQQAQDQGIPAWAAETGGKLPREAVSGFPYLFSNPDCVIMSCSCNLSVLGFPLLLKRQWQASYR